MKRILLFLLIAMFLCVGTAYARGKPKATVWRGKTTAPTTSDYGGKYRAGDFWVDETNGNSYICVDPNNPADWNQIDGGSTFTDQISAEGGVSSHGVFTIFYPGTGTTAFEVDYISGKQEGVTIYSTAGNPVIGTGGIQGIASVDLTNFTDYMVGSESFHTIAGNFLTMISGNSNIVSGTGVTMTISDDQAKAGYIFNTAVAGATCWFVLPNLSETTPWGTITVQNTDEGFAVVGVGEKVSGNSLYWSAGSDATSGNTVHWNGKHGAYKFIAFKSGVSMQWFVIPENVPFTGTTQGGVTLFTNS